MANSYCAKCGKPMNVGCNAIPGLCPDCDNRSGQTKINERIQMRESITQLREENKELRQEVMTLEYVSKAFDNRICKLEQKLDKIRELVKYKHSLTLVNQIKEVLDE